MSRRFPRYKEWCPECGRWLAKKLRDCPSCGWSAVGFQLHETDISSWVDQANLLSTSHHDGDGLMNMS